jgi:hypothetical protein
VSADRAIRDVRSTGRSRRLATPAALLLLSFFLDVLGLRWGLPSDRRSRFYPRGEEWYAAPQTAARLYETAPYESYNPDEGALLKALSHMNPRALDLNPRYFNYPSLSIYLTGAALGAAAVLGQVRLSSSKSFYVEHPEAIGRLYVVGRLLAAVMSACGVLLLYRCGTALVGPAAGLLGALCLALTPLWVRDSHFMLVNVPAAMWMTGAALFAVAAVQRRSAAALLGSAFVAGLAASTKYPAGGVAGLAVLALLESRLPRRGWLALGIAAAAACGFVLGTPYALLAPRAVVAGLLFEGQDKVGGASVGTVVAELVVAQGTVLAAITLAGLALAVWRIGDWRHRFVLVWVMIGLLQRLLSPANFARYLIPALPPLALAAGIALDGVRALARRSGPSYGGWLAGALLVVVFGPLAGYALEVDALMMRPDVREAAARWLEERVPAGATVGVFGNLYFDMPPVNADRYRLADVRDGAAPAVIVVSSQRMALAQPWLERAQASAQRLDLIASFTQRPSSLWTWPVASWPDDWTYTFLDIYILAPRGEAPGAS